MKVNHFKFKDKDSLLAAQKKFQGSYPHLMIMANPDTLVLDVEIVNSIIFDTRMSAIASEFGGELYNN